MYLFELFANIFKKKNFGVLIWLIINTVLVTFCFGFIIAVASNGVVEDWIACLIGFAAYLVTIMAALSPIGEAILRWQAGCKKITDEHTLRRLERLFNDVRGKSAELDSGLNRNIRFYISDDEEPNAFATGRKTICVTSGLLDFTDDEIKGVLAHEFGHLSHKDTDVILIVAVGNMFVSLVITAISLIVRIFNWIVGFFISLAASDSRDGFIIGTLTSITNFIVDCVLGVVLWLWTKLGVLICMTSSRQNEYHADKFAFEAGLGTELRDSLVKLNCGEKKKKNNKTLWASLNASHPDTNLRIEKLESYMAEGICETQTENHSVSYVDKETTAITKPEKSSETELRGFCSGVREEDFFKTIYIPHDIQEEIKAENNQNNSTHPPKKEKILSVKFHKAYIFFFIPLLMGFSLSDLVARGIAIADNGLEVFNILFVVSDITQILVSINTLFDFKNKSASAFYSAIVNGIIAILTTCLAIPELYNIFLYEGFEAGFAVVMCIIVIVGTVGFEAAVGVYYLKRREKLFDNVRNT